MQRRTLFLIVPEGWAVLFVLAIVFLIVNASIGVWAALPVLVAMAVCVLFFRDAPRNVPAEPLSIVAPVDGTIIHRRECYDPYLDREAVKVAIRVNPFGVYLLRSPVEGTIVELTGETLKRLGGVASMIRTDDGDELVMAIRHGSMLGQRPCRNAYGERVGQGRCCGNRRLAQRVELYLPMNCRMEVEVGDHVRAGACVLARLVHKNKGRPRPKVGDDRSGLDGAA